MKERNDKNEELVFSIVKGLYNKLNGNPVKIAKALNGTVDKIAKYFNVDEMTAIEDEHAMLGISPGDMKDVCTPERIEQFVHACEHGMILEEYEAAGLGKELEWREKFRKEWAIDMGSPLNIVRIENLIGYLRDFVDEETIKDLVHFWKTGEKSNQLIFQPGETAKLEAALTLFWCTPTEVIDCIDGNHLSVEEIIARYCNRINATMNFYPEYTFSYDNSDSSTNNIVFEMVKKLYGWFAGDMVQIERVVNSSGDEIPKDFNDMSYIDAVYMDAGVEPGELAAYPLENIEAYVVACQLGMTLEEFETSGFEKVRGELEEINNFRLYKEIDEKKPLDANRIETLISYMREKMGIDDNTITALLCNWKGSSWFDRELGEEDENVLKKVQKSFAMFRVSPVDIAEWLKANQLSVEEVIRRTAPDSRDGGLDECIGDNERAVEENLKDIYYSFLSASPEAIMSGDLLRGLIGGYDTSKGENDRDFE